MIGRSLSFAGILYATIGICVASQPWVVRFDGIGPVKIGMSLSELSVTLHESFSMPEDKDEHACFYVEQSKHPGVAFMIQKGRVTRIDVDRPGVVATAEGIKIGDSEYQTIKVYGRRLKIEPHRYTAPEGDYLTALSDDRQYGIRFETDEGKIVSFYAGKLQAIGLVEGCQ